MTPSSQSAPEEGLTDDDDESLIRRAIYSGCSETTPGACRYCDANSTALRFRIQQLIQKARTANPGGS